MTAAPPSSSGKVLSEWPVKPGETEVMATVQDLGEGVPVVFLHGLVGLNEHWEGVVERVNHKVRCILFELPLLRLRGDDCSIHGATRLTARFLSERFTEPVVLVGNSFGGHVALRVAIEHGHRLGGLVLAGSAGLLEKSFESDFQIRPSKEWLRKRISELYYDPSTHMSEADLDRAFHELSQRHCARALVRLAREARRNHLGDLIHTISVPTLVVWGRNDVVTPPEAAHEFARTIPDTRTVWLDECGHAPMIEKPEEFGRALVAFADEIESMRGSSVAPA